MSSELGPKRNWAPKVRNLLLAGAVLLALLAGCDRAERETEQNGTGTAPDVEADGTVSDSTADTEPEDTVSLVGSQAGAVSRGDVARSGRYRSSPLSEHPAFMWRRSIEAPVSYAPTPGDQSLFVTTADGVVRRLSTDDGSVAWRHRLAGIPAAGVVVHGDTLVALLADGRMELLEAASGESTVHAPTTEMPAGPPIVTERRLYVGTLSGTLMAWDRNDQRSVWRARVPSSPVGMLALHEGQLLLALEDGSVVSVNAADGERLWQVSPGIAPSVGPTASRESLYVAGRDGTVRALALDDGRTLWTYNAESPVYQPLAAFEDTVILALQSGEIRAVSEASVRWEGDLGDAPAAGPTLAGGTLYIPTLGGELHALDARDGSVRFRFPLRGASREVVPFTRDGEPHLAVSSASGMVGVLGEGVLSSRRVSQEASEESRPQGAGRSSTDGDAAPGAAGEGVGEGAGDGAGTATAAREGLTPGGDARMIQASVSNRSTSVDVDTTGVYEFRFPDQEQVPVVAELLDSAGVVIAGNLDKAGLADSFRHRLDANREYSLRWRALRENVAGKSARVELRRLSNS